jgi:glycerol-3-phosphate dehydrogenase (NAD(P)+)
MAVIGAGSWGTALAIQCARAGHPTRLWGRDAALVESMRRARRNARYLPDAEFPPSLAPVADLSEALAGVRDVLVAVPSHAFRATLLGIEPLIEDDARIAWASKGFELTSGLCRMRSRARCSARARARCCRDPRSRARSARDFPPR